MIRTTETPSIADLLRTLREREVRLWLDEGKLRFRAPEGAFTPELRREVQSRKSEVIDFLRQAQGAAAPRMPLERVDRAEGPFPLSFAQQRLWFLDRLEPGSPLYNIPQALRLEGRLDRSALVRALSEIVRRHEVLRTSMPEIDSEPRQVISPPGLQRLPEIDLGGLAEGERLSRARHLAGEEARRPFDLARGPMCRTTLLRLGGDSHVLLVTLHHVAADGWSMGVMTRELGVLYAAFAQGQPSPLPEIEIQYADFSYWQRRWLSGEELERQTSYWREQLEDAPAVLDLATDRPRPPVATFRGSKAAARVPGVAVEKLEALAKAEGGSLFMVLLAAFQVLLARYTGRDDAVVGSPIANRNREEIEGLIGFFVNTLPLRVKDAEGLSFRQLLAAVREVTLGAYAHQDLPFEKIVEELDPERDLARHPIFQVSLVLQNTPGGGGGLELPELQLSPFGAQNPTSKFDWTISLSQSPQGLGGWLEYASDLFDASTARRVLRHYRAILEAAAEDPDRPALDLALTTPGERHQLLHEWNPPLVEPSQPTVVELFEAQADRTPEADAVFFKDAALFDEKTLSYAELDRLANRLAHRLGERGIGPDVAVAICLERSFAMVVAVLGVLKAGGAYVPMDPAYPRERLDYMVENSRAPVILTSAEIAGEVFESEAPAGSELFFLDDDFAALEGASDERPGIEIHPENLLYVIYTSGSTGRPKGVSLAHRALSNLIGWHTEELLGGVRTLQFASLSFDASFHEIFSCGSTGGTLVLIREELRRDVEGLVDLLVEAEVEKATFPVVLLQRLGEIDEERGGLGWRPKELTSTGEQLHVTPALARWVGGLEGCSFHNHYGPSETHVVTAHTLSAPDPAVPSSEWPSHPPIGRPLPACPCHVFDRWGRLAPAGVPGELLLGGVALARGYLGRPALSAEKFVPHPLAGELAAPGARLYKTGDLARTLASGELEYLGRIDFQVKIRGFRVELGEIESVLGRHPQVRQCAVVASRDRSGYTRLVAYAVGEKGEDLSVAALRDHLAERLPDFMVPSAFVTLEALPLSANQKIDRKALPEPEEIVGERGEGGDPRTPVEEGIAEIWRRVLKLDAGARLGVESHFFHLGGHSLLATQVISRLRDVFGVELPVRALFETPTLAGLARAVERALEGGRRAAPPIVRGERGERPPLSFSQERLWFLEQLLPGRPVNNLPSAFRLLGELDLPALAGTLAEIHRRHETLRTTFAIEDGRPYQVIAEPSPLELPRVDLSHLAEPRRSGVAAGISAHLGARPFDLERGPLWRLTLLRLSENEHAVVSVMHHIVSDGWSQGVLVRELAALYNALRGGRGVVLPELPVQYADYAAWQRGWLSGEVLEAELDHWRHELAGVPPVLDLPLDRPRPRMATTAGSALPLRFGPEIAQGVRELAASSGSTLYMVLLAAFQTLLYRHTLERDFCVGTPIAGRNRAEIEGLIGFFINTQVMRAEIDPRSGFAELVARTRERALAAYAHQELPFEKLVEELQPERSLDHTPLYQVMFVLQNAPGGALELEGLELRPFKSGSGAVRSDLALNLYEAGAGLAGTLNFKTGLFDRSTTARLARHFGALLEAGVAEPQKPIEELGLLGPAERHQLVVEWNDWRDPGAAATTVDRVLVEQALRTPDAVAVVDGEHFVSYGGLFRRGHRLAARLRELGAGPEVRVGIGLERSAERVVALIGVLASGAAYLPLEPDLPAERLAFLIDDTACRLVVTDERLQARLPETVEAVFLEGGDADAAPTPLAAPENAIYAIHTSGSTGVPKGVLVSHGAVATRLLWSREWEASSEIAYLGKASLGFDVSVLETFVPLASGGRVVLARPGGQWDVGYLADLVERQRLTHTSFAPSMFAAMLERPELNELQHLEVLYTAGEEVSQDLVDRLKTRLGVPLVNRYGPTEITIAALGWPCETGDRGRSVPIGRPLAGARVWVVDRRLRPLPMGVAGELAIGGPGVARGYLGRPGRTAQSFVPDGLSDEPGSRLYLTGDRARQRTGGEVEYLGRLDRQVKVRGFRIELGEIETSLREHPAVREAAAAVRPAPSGLKELVAWVEAGSSKDAAGVSSAELRTALAERLPEYMVPAVVEVLEELPRLPSGKLDRKALEKRAPVAAGSPAAGSPAAGAPAAGSPVASAAAPRVAPRSELEVKIAGVWAEVLGLEQVGAQDNFFDLGGHSLLLVRVQGRLREVLGLEVPMVDLFRYPTVAALAGSLGEKAGTPPKPRETRRHRRERRPGGSDAIAIVGMAGRFPGAPDIETFWENLRSGVESISFFTDEELLESGVDPQSLENPNYVKAQGRLDDFDLFDAALFGMSPREAQLIDPQQRLFLETAWEALENAGCDPSGYPGPIGVFGGVGLSRYWMNLMANPATLGSVGVLAATLANDKDFLPTRVSYKLDLRGPSINVQTACSTSLVAAHLACRSLAEGECDMALAGGSSISIREKSGYLFEPDGILSPDGHCRTFDAKAQGTINGSGVGLVVLKRLDDALEDGDVVRAVIRGSAINNDGSFKVGFTAPSVEGQARVISDALQQAGVEPASVGMIEAHGTATPLGDPIEVAALKEVFGRDPEKHRLAKTVALGSVKTNVGHCGAAAGVAGMIKTVFALERGEIPPSLHFESPNPELGLEASPFYVPTEARPWPAGEGPRRAGLSSFGLGGTNAHLVLEEPPATEPSGPARPGQLLLLSAQSADALEAVTDRLVAYLESHPDEADPGRNLADVAFTLQTGRRRLPHRRAVVCRDREDALEVLRERDPRRLLGGVDERTGRPVAFLFSGLGDHHPQMARGLYEHEPAFREALDQAAELFEPHLGLDLREVLFPGEAPEEEEGEAEMDLKALLGRGRPADDKGPLAETRVAQPAVFAVEWALSRLLQEWGLEPEAMIGYSLGEFTAAAVAGVFSLEDACEVVATRAQLIDEIPPGAMLAVPMAPEDLEPLLGGELEIAARNAPEVTVVAGPVEAVEALEAELEKREVSSQRLQTSHAFHTRMLEPVAGRFAELLGRLELHEPRVPYLSNVTGTWIAPGEATDPQYWVRHLCGTVRFADGLAGLVGGGTARILIELGPGQALATAARQHPARPAEVPVLAALRDARERRSDRAFLLATLGRLWLAGADVDWRAFARPEKRRRVVLPSYPFQRQRYFLDAGALPMGGAPAAALGPRADVGRWFYAPSWKLSPPPAPLAEGAGGGPCLLVGPRSGLRDGLRDGLAAELERAGRQVVQVFPGEDFRGIEEGKAGLDLLSAEDWGALLEALEAVELAPRTVVYLGGLDDAGDFDQVQERTLYPLLALTRALAKSGHAETLDLVAVTRHGQKVDGGDTLEPAQGTVRGFFKVLPQEYRNLLCRTIDVDVGPRGDFAGLAACLAAELAPVPGDDAAARAQVDREVAWRGRRRFVAGHDPVELPAPEGLRPGLRQGGVYLLTGGYGRIGGVVGEYLAREAGAKLALLGRSGTPPREGWDAHLEAHGEDDATSRRILRVRELEAVGAEVLPLEADASDGRAMAAAVAATREKFGTLHGVLHLAGVTQRDLLLVSAEATGPETCRHHFAPKAKALEILDEVLKGGEGLDFVLLFSSLSTVLGGLGFSAYAAANAYMDAFAEARGGVWTSIAWDGWRRTEEPGGAEDFSMAPSRSAEAFHRSLALAGTPRLVVSTGALEPRIDRWVRFTDAGKEKAVQAGAEAHARPELANAYVAPRDEDEKQIAEVWADLLGLEQVGVYDNFFELGGDSLVATQLVSRLRRVLKVELPLQEFLGAPTVSETAELTRREDVQQEEELSEIEAALAMIQGLSEDELEAALEAEPDAVGGEDGGAVDSGGESSSDENAS